MAKNKSKNKASIVIFMISLVFLVFFLNGCNHHEKGGEKNLQINGRYIIMVIAPNNFKDEEYFMPREMFEKSGYEVITVSSHETAFSVKGKEVKVNATINQMSNELLSNASALVFSGGPGASVYFKDNSVRNMILEANKDNKTIGAICLAPVILANSGVLKGKHATVWDHSFINRLLMGGAKYVNQSVVVDGNIITSNGPEHAKEFAEAILKQLNNS